MKKKKLELLVCILAIALCVSFANATNDWNGSVDNLWSTAGNWTEGVPISSGTTRIDASGASPQPLIEDGITAVADWFFLGSYTTGNTLTVTGGSLTSHNAFLIGQRPNSAGTLNISGDGAVTASQGILIGNDPNTTGIVNMSGGTFDVLTTGGGWWQSNCGIGDMGSGTFNMSGGTLTVAQNLMIAIASDAHGTLDMTDGMIDVAGTVYIDYVTGVVDGPSRGESSPGAIQLDGGIITAGNLVIGPLGSLDLAGGAMMLDGNKELIIDGYVTQGLITGYGVQDAVDVDYNPAIGKTTLAAEGSDFNFPPQIDAGDYQSISWLDTDTAQLAGTAIDDGKLVSPVDLMWSDVSGPGSGSVEFSDPTIVNPTATFGAVGMYELRLRGYDGEKDACDVVTICVRPDNYPIAHWGFDKGSGDTVDDDSANNNVGVLSGNSEPNWVSGWIDSGAMKFFGVGGTDVSSYVNITTDPTAVDPSLDNLRYDVTLAAWFKIDDLADAYYPVIIATSDEGWRLYVDTSDNLYGKVTFTPGDNLLGSRVYSTTTFMDNGGWHHVVGVYDYANSKSHLYVDGVLDDSVDNSGMLAMNDVPVTIGARATSGTEVDRSWNGMIDDVRIYSYALSAAQVADLVAMGDVPPVVDVGKDQTYAIQRGPLQLDATVTEDGIPAVSTLKWTADPCTATFSNDTILNPIVTFPEAGTYDLTLAADDTAVTGYGEVTITVINPVCQDIIDDELLMTSDVSGPNGTPDCYVNLYDFAAVAGDWLSCNDPRNSECEFPY